jgi:hypothetical protein
LTDGRQSFSSPRRAAGPGAWSIEETFTGLQPGTAYSWVLIAENSVGTNYAFGTIRAKDANPPQALTLEASDVVATGATLRGSGTGNNLATTAWFEWWKGGTSDSVKSDPVALGAGNWMLADTLQRLEPNTLYVYRLVAQNAHGTTSGDVQYFMTPQVPAPVVTTLPPSGVAATRATLQGSGNANGVTTSVWFEWIDGNGVLVTSSPVTVGSGAWSVSHPLMNLIPGKVYEFTHVAANVHGEFSGGIVAFTTPDAARRPTVVTLAAADLGAIGATLNGSVRGHTLPTTAWFEWWRDGTSTVSSSPPVASGTGEQLVQHRITALEPNTQYTFRVVARNARGTSNGAEQYFRTRAGAPEVTTEQPYFLGSTMFVPAAQLSGNGLSTEFWWEIGTSADLANATELCRSTPGDGYWLCPSARVTPATTYFYRAVARNSAGTTYGPIVIMRSLAQPQSPTVRSMWADPSIPRISAFVDPNAPGTSAWFIVSTSAGLADYFEVCRREVAEAETFSCDLSGLSPNTRYYWTIQAANAHDRNWGETSYFDTPASVGPAIDGASAASIAGTPPVAPVIRPFPVRRPPGSF